jgi:ATP/maltotriose-dependent transcriptional regulator MalT
VEWGVGSPRFQNPAKHRLTERETEVMSHVAQARVDKEIAQALNLSVLTVKRHLHNIYAKLGVANRVAAINHLSSNHQQPNRP